MTVAGTNTTILKAFCPHCGREFPTLVPRTNIGDEVEYVRCGDCGGICVARNSGPDYGRGQT